MAPSFAQRLLGLIREVLQGTLTVIADPAARAGRASTPTSRPPATLGQAALDRIDDYFNAADPALEAYLAAVDDVIAARDAIQEFVARHASPATPPPFSKTSTSSFRSWACGELSAWPRASGRRRHVATRTGRAAVWAWRQRMFSSTSNL